MSSPRVKGKNPAAYRRVMEEQRTEDPLGGRTQTDIDIAAADKKLRDKLAEIKVIAEGGDKRG